MSYKKMLFFAEFSRIQTFVIFVTLICFGVV